MRMLLTAAIAIAAANSAWQSANAQAADAEYVATLTPLNTKASNLGVKAQMRFLVHGDDLTIRVTTSGVPPTIEHWQHFHGFADGRQSVCPTMAADTSGDGLVDIRETEPAAGTTMVPFNVDPVAMVIPTNTYPHASANGTYSYEKTVSLKALNAAFGSHYDGQTIDLDKRVVLIHGIPQSTQIPPTVASLGTIPARTTLPLACGPIKRVR